jgi:hypothetical protein
MSETWKYIDAKRSIIEKSNWIEEEEELLNWAENPIFEKQPLDHIILTFLYVNLESTIVGVAKTFMETETREMSSGLKKSDFFDKVNSAKHPKLLFGDKVSEEWLDKKYTFKDASMFHLSLDHENISDFRNNKMIDMGFQKDFIKIPNALTILHNISEIFVTMREEVDPPNVNPGLKSILKNKSTIGKTKKVRISEESPKQFVFSTSTPVRKTRRIR